MIRLSADQKVFIVQRLACFDSLQSVVDAVKEVYAIDVSKQALQAYDPGKAQGRNMSAKLVQVFNETRKRFLADTAGIPISHKAVRIAILQRLADKAEAKGNAVLVQSVLEQAAKEMGDSYTNNRRVDMSSTDGTMTPKAFDPSSINPDMVAGLAKLLTG